MRFLYLIICFSFFVSANAQELKENAEKSPVVYFTTTEMDLGESMEGEKLEYTFKFINKGNEPLVITNILPSCGCTIVDWSRVPVNPGKKGQIKAIFDTKNRIGLQEKSIIILSNSVNEKEELKIKVNVIPRAEAKMMN